MGFSVCLFVVVCFSYLPFSFFPFGCSGAGCSLLPKHRYLEQGQDGKQRMSIPWPWMRGCLFRGHGRQWREFSWESLWTRQEAHTQKYLWTELWRRGLEPYRIPLGQALLNVCDAFSQRCCILIPTATLEGEWGSQSYAQLPDRPDGTQDDRISGRESYSDIYKIPSY